MLSEKKKNKGTLTSHFAIQVLKDCVSQVSHSEFTMLFTKIHCLRIYFIILLSSLSSDSPFIKIRGLCGKLRIPKITTVTPFPHVPLCVCDLATSHQEVMSNNPLLESGLNPVTRLTNKICEVAFCDSQFIRSHAEYTSVS